MYLFFISENNNNGDDMTKKITTISILILSIVLVSLYLVKSTYSIIDNIFNNQAFSEMTITDLLKDKNGEYSDLYYEIKRELDITNEEYNILLTSVSLNKALEIIITDNNELNENDVYNLIIDSIMEDRNIDNYTKDKVIKRVGIYINDIIDYINEKKN